MVTTVEQIMFRGPMESVLASIARNNVTRTANSRVIMRMPLGSAVVPITITGVGVVSNVVDIFISSLRTITQSKAVALSVNMFSNTGW